MSKEQASKSFMEYVAGAATGIKNFFQGGGLGWKIPVAVGAVVGVTVSGPIGLGVAGGVWATSKVASNDGLVNKLKNGTLMGVGAGVCGASTAVGATIGSFVFPVIGTFVGAAVGCIAGMVAAKIATKHVKGRYMESPKAVKKEGFINKIANKFKGKDRGKDQKKSHDPELGKLSPEKTPGEKKQNARTRGS